MKKVLKELWKVASKYKKREIIGLMCTILYTSSIFMSTIVSKYLIDDVIVSKSHQKMLMGILVFMLGCMGQPIFGYFKNTIFMKISEDIVLDYRVRMFEKLLKAPIEFFEKSKNGEIVSRICNDGITVSDFLTNFFVVFIKNIVLVLMILVGMLLMSPLLTGIVVVLFASFAIVNYKMSKEFAGLSKKCRESYDSICVKISQSIQLIDTIKSFTQEDKWIKDFETIAQESYSNNLNVRNKDNMLSCLSTSMVVLSLTIVYGVGGYLILTGQSTIGTIVAFGLFFQNLSSPMYEFMNANINIKKMEPIFQRINEYLNLSAEWEGGLQVSKIDSIELKNLNFQYENIQNEKEETALKNINMKFPQKGLIAFVGDSGAGKSTIVKLLNAYYDTYDGQILLNGKEMRSCNIYDIRKRISIVSQDIELMNDTVYNNILMGQVCSKEDVEKVSEYVNLNEVVDRLQNGYDTILNERINLSGGEKQRMAIARGIMKKAHIYIFDEPTAALDNMNEMHIKKMIEELAKDNLVIIITHNLYLLNKSDYIYTMKNGEVVEEGSYFQLMQGDSYFKELVQILNR